METLALNENALAQIAELKAQIAACPPGYIVKTGSGDQTLFFHHYRENGRKKIDYLPPCTVFYLNEKIKKRKKLEATLKKLEKELNLDVRKKRRMAWPISLVSDVLLQDMFPEDQPPFDLVASVEYALSFLDAKHVEIVRGYYQKGLCLKDVAQSLDISTTRAAQMRAIALKHLRREHLFLVLKYGVQGAVSFGYFDALEMARRQTIDSNCPRYPENAFIGVLGLSDKTYNALSRSNIHSVHDILEMSWEELLTVRNLGAVSVIEIESALTRNGFTKDPLPTSLQTLKRKRAATNEKEGENMNTRINYRYRDGSNYKVHNTCVVEGTFTEDQKAAIEECLACGEYFIPSNVGLPEVRFEDWDEEDDHPWFELDVADIEDTDDEVTVSTTAKAVYEAFLAHKDKWEIPAWAY